jgi:endonuclease/exonuclease/phosphatase family metal-dependent hydrolase
VLSAAAIMFWTGFHKTCSGPAEGTGFTGTFNIDGGQGLDDKVDLSRTADVIRGCDLIGLNEVHGPAFGEAHDQAFELGQLLNMPELFAPVERRWWRDAFGSGVLSTCPVQHWQRFPLSTSAANSFRNVVLARVGFAGASLNVVLTHLDRHDDRESELRAVSELFLSLQPPAILMGDLNSIGSDAGIARLCSDPAIVNVCARIPNLDPLHHNDWIFLRGLRCLDAGVIDKHVSDHAFFWTEVEGQ